MSTNTIRINVDVDDRPVKSLKAELRETIQQLQASDLGSAQFDALNAKAALLKDKMSEVNEQVAVFATGSKYEQVGNSFGEITAGMASMDFDRVTQGAKLFAKTAGSITFKDAIGSVKQLGSAFVSIGKTILTNPLFLIVGIIALIVIAVVKLLDKMGVLKVIFDAIGKAIDFVIQKLKDFLDWIGLTTFAAEDAAKRQVEAQEKIIEAHEKKAIKVADAYDHEIKMANIAGEDTTRLEKQKQIALIETSKQQVHALRLQAIAMMKTGEDNKEKLKEVADQIVATRGLIHEAQQELKVINAQESADLKKSQSEKQSANESDAKNAQQRIKDAQAKADEYAKNRLAATRSIRDAELSLMAEGVEKELAISQEKTNRLIADTKTSKSLIQAEKDTLIKSFAEQEIMNQKAINDKFIESEKAKQKELNDIFVAEQVAKIELEDATFDAMEQLRMTEHEKKVAQIVAESEELLALKGLTAEDELLIAKDTAEKIKALDEKQKEENEERDKKELDRKIKQGETMADVTKSGLQGVSDLVSAFAGKSLGAQKKAFETQKKLNIAMATIDTIKGAVSAFTGMTSQIPGPVGIALGVVAAAGVAASGVANIKKITSTTFNGGGSVGGGGASAGGGMSTPSMGSNQTAPTPQMNLNGGVTQNAGGSKVREKVVVVDYYDIQNKGKDLSNMQQKVTLA